MGNYFVALVVLLSIWRPMSLQNIDELRNELDMFERTINKNEEELNIIEKQLSEEIEGLNCIEIENAIQFRHQLSDCRIADIENEHKQQMEKLNLTCKQEVEKKSIQIQNLINETSGFQAKQLEYERQIIKLQKESKESQFKDAEIDQLKQQIFNLKEEERQSIAKLKSDYQEEINEKTIQIQNLRSILIDNQAEIDLLKNQSTINQQKLNDCQTSIADINIQRTTPRAKKENPYICPIRDGTQLIQIGASNNFYVDCIRGWIQIQKRFTRKFSFNHKLDKYISGFKFANGDSFLGLDKIHLITNSDRYELFIELTDFFGHTLFARYDYFRISGKRDGYRLYLGNYTGSAGDGMSYSIGQQFATYDNKRGKSCKLSGGWWLPPKTCQTSNLNQDFPMWIVNGSVLRVQTVFMMISPQY